MFQFSELIEIQPIHSDRINVNKAENIAINAHVGISQSVLVTDSVHVKGQTHTMGRGDQ